MTDATSTSTSTSTKQSILLAGADEEEQDIDEVTPTTVPTPTNGSDPRITTQTKNTAHHHHLLISPIISPSPFPHHNDSTTSDRYRSALERIQSSPESDAEAWQAIMTECMSLYKSQLLPELEMGRTSYKMMMTNPQQQSTLPSIIPQSEELSRKLDWVESCYGHLLSYFPYAGNYYVNAVEFLLARSALPFESLTGGDDDFSLGVTMTLSETQKACEAKIERIFKLALGVTMDGSRHGDDNDEGGENGDSNMKMMMMMNTTTSDDIVLKSTKTLGGMCTSCVELWLLYIRKRSRDARRKALESHLLPSSSSGTTTTTQSLKLTQDGEQMIRDWIIGAYETALTNGAAFVNSNYMVWKQYLNYVKSWNMVVSAGGAVGTMDHNLHSKQKELLRSIYQRIITLPMLGLDSLWQEYEIFEKAQSEQLASALIAENMPKYQHARSIYLERNRVFQFAELQIGRLAIPPADFEFARDHEYSGNEGGTSRTSTVGGTSGVGGVGGGLGGASALGGLGMGNTTVEGDSGKVEELKGKMKEEGILLAKWKKRCGYERTNPERLSAAELTTRVRQCYKDAICSFMRHVEIWYEWSTWELLNTGGGAGAANASNDAGPGGKKRSIQCAVSVLALGENHLPDSTLLAYAHAQIKEGHEMKGSDLALSNGHPIVSSGDAAINVMEGFCKRAGNTLGYVLLQRLVRKYKGISESRAIFARSRRHLRMRVEDIVHHEGSGVESDIKALDENAGPTELGGVSSSTNPVGNKIVSNRSSHDLGKGSAGIMPTQITSANQEESILGSAPGYITWHLYSSHASIEHRLNDLPEVAARIYELGLRKHKSFLSTPQYVLEYASLLLELHDEENLRALLTRAIAACEEENKADSDSMGMTGMTKSSITKREAQRPLWDMMLKFESNLSTQSGDFATVQSIESRRRKALYGPEFEDVSGGDTFGLDENDVRVGMHKSSLNDDIIRTDGYDVSSRVVNGLSRLVDSMETTGVLGQDPANMAIHSIGSMAPGGIWKDDGASGRSDASFRRRKYFQTESTLFSGAPLSSSGLHASAKVPGGVPSPNKLLSAKDRLAFGGQTANITAATFPEWLRGLIDLLPATGRMYRGAKAPPHLIEMTLATLRESKLPAVREADDLASIAEAQKILGENGTGINSGKRGRDFDGDSSDEENANGNNSGYGNQFRSRQRARMSESS